MRMWRNVGVSATQSVEVGCADTESPYYMTFFAHSALRRICGYVPLERFDLS